MSTSRWLPTYEGRQSFESFVFFIASIQVLLSSSVLFYSTAASFSAWRGVSSSWQADRPRNSLWETVTCHTFCALQLKCRNVAVFFPIIWFHQWLWRDDSFHSIIQVHTGSNETFQPTNGFWHNSKSQEFPRLSHFIIIFLSIQSSPFLFLNAPPSSGGHWPFPRLALLLVLRFAPQKL